MVIIKRDAQVLMEDKWAVFLQEVYAGSLSQNDYWFYKEDTKYGVNLFSMAYPTNWTTIALHDLIIPKTYQDDNY